MTFPWRTRTLRRAPRSRGGKLAVLAVAAAAMGAVSVKFGVLLADVRPYAGWDWLLAVAGGIVIAVAWPWAVVRVTRGSARWTGWVLAAYVIAIGVGLRYYLGLRFTPPRGAPPPLPPPSWLVLQIAGLAAVAFTVAVITLLLLVALAEVIAPGPVRRLLGPLGARRAGANRHQGPVHERFPARLRLDPPGAAPGPWLRGELHVRPGSLLWEPATGVYAAPAELAAAAVTPGDARRGGQRERVATADTPAGRVQLECGADLLGLLQRAAADLARSSHSQPDGMIPLAAEQRLEELAGVALAAGQAVGSAGGISAARTRR